MKTLLLLFATAILGVAAAAGTYKVTLFYPSYIGSQQLRTGDCQLLVENNHVVFKQGRKKVEAEARVENGPEKFKHTSVRYKTAGGKYQISEISLRGTKTKLVFD